MTLLLIAAGGPGMKIEGKGLPARTCIGASDAWGGKPLYEAIVHMLRERGIEGATVLRGIEGLGRSARLHTSRILGPSEDLPLVIEVVDGEDPLRAVLPELDAIASDGLTTLGSGDVIVHRSSRETQA